MANPTVEREMRRLLPAECDYLVGRLVGQEGDSQGRLVEYAEELPRALEQFGGLKLSGIAFACTASSYLIGREREDAISAEIDIPVMWASGVIRRELTAKGVSKLAVISPYPEPIHAAGLRYWQDAGHKVVFDSRVEIGSADTRNIYNLDGSEARPALARARDARPDAILLSGTGMPTASLINPAGSPPILSSNYCLAQAMITFTGAS
ncbi:hypothetical protein [Altererythrobacter sp. MF3-039]|uniref:maleate cis-trans isomerase family protein n=1 Tax=Altererythrobacter sp. MF3-039 TaxID=3252901 RepID=UPI00390CB905